MTATHDLKPLEKKILEVIQSVGAEWLGRAEIARKIGRPSSIQPNDIEALTKLVDLGLIETKQVPRGVAGVKWVYRVK
jgi:predicted transcriptional regulator